MIADERRAAPGQPGDDAEPRPDRRTAYDDPIAVAGDASTRSRIASIGGFARGLEYSDAALDEFLGDLEASDEETVVVFYGDHYPGIFGDEPAGPEPRASAQLETPLLIWSSQGQEPRPLPLTSANQFMPYVFDLVGEPLPPYYELLVGGRRGDRRPAARAGSWRRTAPRSTASRPHRASRSSCCTTTSWCSTTSRSASGTSSTRCGTRSSSANGRSVDRSVLSQTAYGSAPADLSSEVMSVSVDDPVVERHLEAAAPAPVVARTRGRRRTVLLALVAMPMWALVCAGGARGAAALLARGSRAGARSPRSTSRWTCSSCGWSWSCSGASPGGSGPAWGSCSASRPRCRPSTPRRWRS